MFGKPGEDETAFSASYGAVSEEVLDWITALGWVILPSAPLLS